jgi:hypothetical protein
MSIAAGKNSGGTQGPLAADENLVAFSAAGDPTGAKVAILDADGDLWLNGGLDLEGGSNAGYIQGEEISDPGVAAAGHFRLYARAAGGGKTELVVVFDSGAEQVIAVEP